MEQFVKRCSRCSAVLPLSGFYKDLHCKRGVSSQCKECIKSFVRRRYAERREAEGKLPRRKGPAPKPKRKREGSAKFIPGEWRAIPGYEGFYEVSSCGLVRSVDRTDIAGRYRPGVLLSQGDDRGYRFVRLSKDREQRVIKVHALVVITFIGQCPPGHEVDHINGVRSDNRLVNLEYVTHLENVRRICGRGKESAPAG